MGKHTMFNGINKKVRKTVGYKLLGYKQLYFPAVNFFLKKTRQSRRYAENRHDMAVFLGLFTYGVGEYLYQILGLYHFRVVRSWDTDSHLYK